MEYFYFYFHAALFDSAQQQKGKITKGNYAKFDMRTKWESFCSRRIALIPTPRAGLRSVEPSH